MITITTYFCLLMYVPQMGPVNSDHKAISNKCDYVKWLPLYYANWLGLLRNFKLMKPLKQIQISH